MNLSVESAPALFGPYGRGLRVGRTMLAPRQIPFGLVAAVLAAPYFAWLLRRTARSA